MRRSAEALALAAAFLALAACGESGGGENTESGNGIAGELARVEVRPGQWEVVTEIVSAAQEGLPLEVAQRMKGRRRAFSHCITPEEAARPDANFLASRRDGHCTDQAFEMRGGRISGTMACRDPDGAETQVRMSGRYGPESYEMRMDMETPGIGRDRMMTIVARHIGRRTGDCPQQKETKQ